MTGQLVACRHLLTGGSRSAHYCRLNYKPTDCIGLISRCECPEVRVVQDKHQPARKED